MQLNKKKELASRALGVGKDRIIFNKERLAEVKDAITKQDMRDIMKDGGISIREIKGRTSKKRKVRRRQGSVRKKVNKGKREYMIITRKLRAYLVELLKQNKITSEEYIKLRKEIRMSQFRSKSHMKERIDLLIKERGVR